MDEERLDRAFIALGRPGARRIVARLSRGPATVNELAEPFAITKQAVSKHIQVLEQAGLVTRTRDAQRRPVHLNAARTRGAHRMDRPLPADPRAAVPRAGRPARHRPTAQPQRHRRRREPATGENSHEHIPTPSPSPHPRGCRSSTSSASSTTGRGRLPGAPRPGARPAVARRRAATRWSSTSSDFPPAAATATSTERRGRRQYGFNGVFHVVRENEFAIQTFEFEGYPDVVGIESMTFERLGGGRTRLAGHSVYPTLEARDGMVGSGMEPACARATRSSTTSSRRLTSTATDRRSPPWTGPSRSSSSR